MDRIAPRFVTFEGGEGAGKSTQIRLLADWLTAQGVAVTITREPGGAPGAELIRDIVLKGATDRWAPMSEALLMTAARTEHVERTIKPALADNHWVLCDRFYDSTVAYQGAGHGLGIERMQELQANALPGVRPDLTFMLDLPVETGLARAVGRESAKADREDRFERMDLSFHEKIRAAFLTIAARAPDRCVIINADTDITSLQEELRAAVSERFLDAR
jgi:dTMP kinase